MDSLHHDRTLSDLLQHRAAAAPDFCGFCFLGADGSRETRLTYRELDLRARMIAGELRQMDKTETSSQTVLVVFPAGLDFLTSFFGCLYAGKIAVPTRYPHPRRPLIHLAGIAADCGAKFGYTTAQMQPVLAAGIPSVRWLVPPATAEASEAGGHIAVSAPEDIAYLQYTSGSTGAPKGVMICHGHVLANCEMLRRRYDIAPTSRFLSWLPHYHDLGLVYGLMEPLYVGCAAVFMSPVTFAQRPVVWLEAMARYRATHTAAPNFAYEMCARLTETQLAGLDLSHWRVGLCGAEPVRAETIVRFTKRFAPFGYSPAAMCPGYGLAEYVLAATLSGLDEPPVVRRVDAAALREGRFEPTQEAGGVWLAGSGKPVFATEVLIVDSDSGLPAAPGRTGEVWLRGSSLTAGYWQRPDAAVKFTARRADTGEGPYLRTGDIGVLHEGELFVLGRLDDVIIVRGAKFHPEDLERTIEASHPALRSEGGVAFAFDWAGEPRLVAVQEVERHGASQLESEEVAKAVLAAVSEGYDQQISAVVLLRSHTLPRTHSGKKQRKECRRRFLSGELEMLDFWVSPQFREAWAAAGIGKPALAAQCAPAAGG